MNSFKKYFKIILVLLIISPFIHLNAGALNEQLVGNMIENIVSDMTPAEQEAFAKEIEYQQEKLMQMTPEERAAYEEMMMKELDNLIATNPELFEKPNPATLPAPKQSIEIPEITEPSIEQNHDTKNKSTNKTPNPKPVTIDKELKNQYRQLVQKIILAIDTLLLKTNNMPDITHTTWNNSTWLGLKTDLQNLKSYLPMTINSDKLLAEFLKDDHKALRDELINFEKLISMQANQIKTPDAMGLTTIFEGQLKVNNQAQYDQAISNFKQIVDKLTQQLNQSKLVSKIKNLLHKYAPEQLKNFNKKNKNTTNKNNQDESKTCSTLNLSNLVKQAQELISNLNNSANTQLLELLIEYQNKPSASLKRKLQWKISELELHLEQFTKLFDISVKNNCQAQVLDILNKHIDSYLILEQIITTLNLIKDQEKNIELNNLYRKFSEIYEPSMPN